MNMKRSWNTWKKLIFCALGVLLLADLALVFVLWQASREGVESMRAQRARLETQAKLLKADVARGDKIRASLPTILFPETRALQYNMSPNITGSFSLTLTARTSPSSPIQLVRQEVIMPIRCGPLS